MTGSIRTSLSFNLGVDSNNPYLTVGATVHAVHPRYTSQGAFFYMIGDLALLRLDEPITITVPAERFRGVDPPTGFGLPRKQYFMAGFGTPGLIGPDYTSASSREQFRPDGLKRAGSNMAESLGRPTDYDAIYTDFATNSGYDPNIDLEWNGSPGDSGGGMFMEVNGAFQLAGTITGASFYAGGSGSTASIRTSLFNDWIDQQIASVPEPSSLVFVLAASVTLVACRKRNRQGNRKKSQFSELQ